MARYERRDFPDFSWSHSRDKLLTECKQSYFLRYYASHNGWERDAPVEARQAWGLGKLLTVPSALGMSVHQRALECAEAVAEGRDLPRKEALIERVRSDLNELRLRRDVDAFRAAPKQSPMLHEIYYHRRLDPSMIEQTREKIVRCITNLVSAPVWRNIRETLADGGEMRVVNSFASFVLHGVTVYAAPDLVYRRADGTEPTIIDWKSGRLDGVIDQVAVYGLLLRDLLGWPPDAGRYACRVVGLDEGREEVFGLTIEDLADAEQRIGRSVARMRAMLADPFRNEAHGWEHYSMSWGKGRCRVCPYREICEDRIAAEIRRRAGEAA